MALLRTLPDAFKGAPETQVQLVSEILKETLQKEISEDPEGRGYAGQGATGIWALLIREVVIETKKKCSSRLALLANDVSTTFTTLEAALNDKELGEAIVAEITADPTGRGYVRAMHSPDQVLKLLSEPWFLVTSRKVLQPRWPQLIQGLPLVPSTVGAGDVADLLGMSEDG